MARKLFTRKLIIFTAVIILLSLAEYGDSQLTQTSGCVCAGHSVIFTCSIVGGGNTIWNGTAFNCPSSNSVSNNQIFLRHSAFAMMASGICNDGDIVGEAVSVDLEIPRYTSRLNVTVNSDVVGRNISCIYDDTTRTMERLIGTITIELTSGDELSRPSSISLVGVSPSELIFEWNSVTHNCAAILYNVTMTGSGCGNCPPIVDSPTATCSIDQLLGSEVRICTFRVQGILCGNISGPSSEAAFRLQVPDAPTINVIPTYSQQNDTLLKITISFPEMSLLPFSVSGSTEISSSPTSYIVHYMNTSDYICDSDILPATSCENGECSHEFDVTRMSCYPFNRIAVTVFAANVLGNGSMSNSITTGSVNNFVKITYDEDTTGVTFFCRFLNQQDITNISCSINYVQCERLALSVPKQLNATSNGVPNVLQIVLTFDDSGEATYCYSIEAANASYTVRVDGTLNFGQSLQDANMLSGGAIGGITVGIIFFVVVIVLLLSAVFLVSWWVVTKRRTDKDKRNPIGLEDLTGLNFDTDDLEIVDPKQFKLYEVDKNCELGSFMANCGLHYKRIGSVYYEFSRKQEIITEDKDIILMKVETKEKFRSKRIREIIGAPDTTSGSEVTLKPRIPGYKVFVQSKGVGHRPLTKKTSILYDISPPTDSTDSGNNGVEELIPVADDRFLILDVKKSCKLHKFINKTHSKRYEPGCAFFEFTSATEDIGIEKEVILMEKSSKKLFTGHKALHMVGGPGAEIPKPDKLQDWRVFIQSKHHGARHLEAGTQVLYQEPKSVKESWKAVDGNRFMKLKVDTDSRLDTFVKSRQLEYKSGCFFFEFLADDVNVERITDNQKVVIMDEISEKLFSGAEVKKTIGAPVPTFRNLEAGYRVFIQNNGAGTRSLESGTWLLYEHAKA